MCVCVFVLKGKGKRQKQQITQHLFISKVEVIGSFQIFNVQFNAAAKQSCNYISCKDFFIYSISVIFKNTQNSELPAMRSDRKILKALLEMAG